MDSAKLAALATYIQYVEKMLAYIDSVICPFPLKVAQHHYSYYLRFSFDFISVYKSCSVSIFVSFSSGALFSTCPSLIAGAI